jgi:hypothetical protein
MPRRSADLPPLSATDDALHRVAAVEEAALTTKLGDVLESAAPASRAPREIIVRRH